MDAIRTRQWVLPNRLNFTEWVYHTFHPSKYTDDNEDKDKKGVRLSPHQKLIRDVLNSRSPYRGILLYHGLGVGKTRASILTAEDFIRNRKKIVVMLPASLQKNYRNEILNSSRVGRLRWKQWYRVSLDLSKPAHVAIMLSLQEEFPFETDFVNKHTRKSKTEFWIPYIPREVNIPDSHLSGPRPWKELSGKELKEVQSTHDYLIDHTYEFINYNGLLKSHLVTKYKSDFFEDKLVIIDEAHNFISQSMNEENITAKLYSRLLHSKNTRFLLLTGTPFINQPQEIAYTMNLLRGPIETVRYDFGVRKEVPLFEAIETKLLESTFSNTRIPMQKLVDYIEFSKDPKQKIIDVTLIPQGFARPREDVHLDRTPKVEYVEQLQQPNLSHDTYKTSINKFFEEKLHTLKGKDKWLTRSALPFEEKEFNQLFVQTGDDGKLEMKNESLFIQRCLGLVSHYRVNDKYFPEMLPMTIRRMSLTDHQFMTYINNRHDEQQMARRAQLSKIKRGGVASDEPSVYRTFSRMACNFVFPKSIKRSYPMSIRAAFREMDNAYKDVDDLEKKVEEKYEQERIHAMEELEKNSAIYLSEEALMDQYSPKMGQMLADIRSNPGKGLFYSQFREMEGMGIFALALKASGWKELDIRKKEGSDEYEFVDLNVLNPEYDFKRYVIFNQDRTRSDVLLKVFNGEWSYMPKEGNYILKKLQRMERVNNLHGEIAKLMMISQSGAEGISLKEVRQVYILEPFWNQVRIDQVIGRASRTNSHARLEPKDRNVQVFIYVSTLTKEQIEKDATTRNLDREMTSDEHILSIAQRKKHIIEQFENALKKASLDCLNNASNNRIRESNMQCYVPPLDKKQEHEHDVSYTSDIKDHLQLQEKRGKLVQRTKVKGKLVKKGKRADHVVVPKDPVLYDVNAYEHAGVLVPKS
jgi:superfamily II DNA or RNA helicase